MDLTAGILKLDRMIRARKALEIKLETNPDNTGVIKKTIEDHQKTIDYIKKELKFNERFEVKKECQCSESKALPKAGDRIGEGEVVGVFVKVNPINKDGSLSKQTRYVEVNREEE